MAENDEKLHIRLNVNGVDIPMRVSRDAEGMYRSAAKLVNERIQTYVSSFSSRKSEKEILLMAMLDVAMLYERERGKSDAEPFLKSMSLLSASIDQAMKA